MNSTTAATSWPCSAEDCPNTATHAITFRDQYGHVHDCNQHTAEAREWSDVTKVVPLPCPFSHGNGETWIDFPTPLDSEDA